jgi:ABC-type transport system substrate-binding protein
MPVFNNLVIYKQDVAQNSMDTIVPELAESWAWSGDNKTLTFKLRQGVKWHDGKPFTSADVKCTFDMLMGKSQQKFRKNPRKSWYDEVNDVTTNGDFEVAFNLKRPQPALLALLASGYTPVYPCHVSPGDMRTQADRHRPVQVRRVQGQRIDQARPQSRLLEEGPAASRRHRVHHHPQPLDRHSRVRLRQNST